MANKQMGRLEHLYAVNAHLVCVISEQGKIRAYKTAHNNIKLISAGTYDDQALEFISDTYTEVDLLNGNAIELIRRYKKDYKHCFEIKVDTKQICVMVYQSEIEYFNDDNIREFPHPEFDYKIRKLIRISGSRVRI